MCKTIAEGGRCSGYYRKAISARKTYLQQRIGTLLPLLAQRDTLNAEYLAAKAAAAEARAAGDKEAWKNQSEERDAKLREMREVKGEINGIKNETAKSVIKLNEAQDAYEKKTGTYDEYTGDTLGPARRTLSSESNSPEWHRQRSAGVGGSDVGSITSVSHFARREDIFKLKTGQTLAASGDDRPKSGALFRGDAWETQIMRQFAERNPDIRVVHCKDSWQNIERPYQQPNVDGLLYEDGSETPTAILEIKTSSVPADWEDGIPETYRQQMLWYMDAFDLKRGHLAVLIDDSDFRQYVVEPKPGEIEGLHKEVNKFRSEVAEYLKAHPAK